MEELRNLALQLGKMGLWYATFEPDLNDYMHLKKSVDEAFEKNPSTVTAKLEGPQDKLEFFVQMYGVKMLIKCRNARLETAG